MIYIVYHSADFDGFFSGLITGIGVLKEKVNETIKFVPYNYGKDGIFVGKKKDEVKLEDVVEYDDWVYFVDVFYADKEFMNKLIEKIGDPAQVVLIDHHESSIEWIKKECPSIEYSWSANSSEFGNMLSAAGLCWIRFFGVNMPEIVRLISDYDIWNKNDQKRWDEEILPFQYGMRNKGINMYDIPTYLEEYQKIIFEDSPDFRTSAIKDGKAIIEYIRSRAKMVVRSTGFEAFLDVEDNTYLAYFAADYCANSTLFEWGLSEEEFEKYEVFVLCRPVIGSNKSYISIISNRDDIDASKICNMYGGGGHRKIAGCVVNITKYRIDEDDETRVEFEETE